MIAYRCEQPASRLRELLDGQLEESAAADLTRHLDQCESCREQLETLAAEPSWWQEARQSLSGGDPTPALPTAGVSGTAAEPLPLIRDFLDPPQQESSHGRLDEYEIMDVIGCGGMGIVLKAYDSQLDRHVALKVLAPQYATSAAAKRRFAREAQAAAAVVHPHVLAIHGVNSGGRLPYLVMPLINGPSLQQRIDAVGPLDVKDVLRIGMQAAQGLAAAHAQGLVHRDVKPANILLEHGLERVLLTDFGLARAMDDASLTHSGVIAGTPQFMSPEQACGETVDHRTDLFSLGSVLYTMCTARPPFCAPTTLGVMRRICDVAPRDVRDVNPDVPSWLGPVIERLLAKDPADRFQSAADVARLLAQCLAHVQHPTSAALPDVLHCDKPPRRKTRFRSRFFSNIAGLCLVAGTAIGTWIYFSHDRRGDVGAADTTTERTVPPNASTAADDAGGTPQPANDARSTDLLWEDATDKTLLDIGNRLDQIERNVQF
jgi:serine/threonine-protein kinase